MKFDTIKSINYVATVVRVAALHDLEGLDNLRALRVYGMQALVGANVQVGDVGVLFSTEVQLSEDFARANNLYRHAEKNADKAARGYLEDSRRVKAIKLRGHRSDSLFVSLDSLAYLGVKPSDFNVGDVFDSINGQEVCRKYLVREPKPFNGPAARVRRVDLKQFPMHIDSENYWRNQHKIPEDAPVVVTQKLHGTSVRYGKVLVADEKQGWLSRLAERLGVPVRKEQYRFVVGSRTVVKSIDGTYEDGKQHFYGDQDLWTHYAKVHGLDEIIPEGFLVYGEIVGYAPTGVPIQKNYTYDVEPGNMVLYVYRVATIAPGGQVTDLSWPAVKAFCSGLGLKTVPEFATVPHTDFRADDWVDAKYYQHYIDGGDWYNEQPIPLSQESPVDEGVCVRYDGPNGIYILKAKSPIFLGHESTLLDTGVEDIESEETK